jgi:hypothetical protein
MSTRGVPRAVRIALSIYPHYRDRLAGLLHVPRATLEGWLYRKRTVADFRIAQMRAAIAMGLLN